MWALWTAFAILVNFLAMRSVANSPRNKFKSHFVLDLSKTASFMDLCIKEMDELSSFISFSDWFISRIFSFTVFDKTFVL